MAPAQNKKWALDTNIVFDLARHLDAAHSLREIASERKYSLHITPTCLGEIVHKSLNGPSGEKALAMIALSNLEKWNISLLNLPPGTDAIPEQFSLFIRGRGAIPSEEVNDGFILAEASLGGASLLASNDSH